MADTSGTRTGTDDALRLTRPIAMAYTAMVAAVWLSHLIGLVVLLTAGPSVWRADPLWAVYLTLGLLAASWVVLTLVSRQLEPGTNLLMHPLRMLTLLYGSELPVAWRSVRA